jgi:hypothetical protein
VAYTTFIGRDGQQATFSWVTQKIGGVDASVLVLDVNGAPLSTGNPLPITAPSNLPVAVQGTVPVSVAATVPVDQIVLGAALSEGVGLTSSASSQTLKTATAGRKVIYVANGGTSGIWLHFAASAATVGNGVYLPAKSNEPFAYPGEIRFILESGGTAGPVSFVEF